uniref:Fibronectin type-III domain-containing protein n=1 Tax=Syphacia muris TaxID=451379 RepID=A0A0N5ACT6_9BILA
MERQSSRIYFQGKYHKDIYFQGHYHKAMYLTDSNGKAELVWEKIKTGGGVEFTPWGIAYYDGVYYVLEKDPSAGQVMSESGQMVSVAALRIYTGRTLRGVRLRHTEYYYSGSIDSMEYLYFMDCSEHGLEYAFGNHPYIRDLYGTGTSVDSVYRRIPDVKAADYGAQLTNAPSRAVQCGNFGVVFDAEGSYYWCSSTAYLTGKNTVEFYKAHNADDFTKPFQHIGGAGTCFARYTLPEECMHSFAFLAGDRITVCCTPYDVKYYTYADVVKKPFYVCGVSIGGDGRDIRAADLKNKEAAYTGAQAYRPMRLSSDSTGSRPDMLGGSAGFIKVDGTLRGLIIDYSACTIAGIRRDPLSDSTHI